MGPDLADELWSHRVWLTSQARRLGARGDDADDLAQETLLWAWEHWDRRQPHWHLRYWLYLILRRNWLASLRSRYRDRRLDDRLAAAPPPAVARPPDVVYDLLAGLSDKVADVAEARYLGGYTYDETALILGLPVSTVTGRLNEARKKLTKATVH
jgi:RNA polymerase sigma-70 factor (ECF subfamily)